MRLLPLEKVPQPKPVSPIPPTLSTLSTPSISSPTPPLLSTSAYVKDEDKDKHKATPHKATPHKATPHKDVKKHNFSNKTTPPREPKRRKTSKYTTTQLYHQINAASTRLAPIFGSNGFAMFPWKTSVLGTLIGLICAQNTTNSFSAVMYNNLITLEPDSTGLEPNWNRLRVRSPLSLQNALSCGPFYRLKSRMIVKLLNQVYEKFGVTSLDALEDRDLWPDERARALLLSYSGIGVKTTSCMLLYRLCRLSFAVDTNILKIGVRVGWFTGMNLEPSEALPTDRRKSLPSKRQRNVASASSSSSSSSSSSGTLVDVEDSVPATTRRTTSKSLATSTSLKRYAKPAQGYIEKCLATEAFSMDKWAVLYVAHVRLIAMGEVFCHTRRPLCGGCPLNTICKFANKYPEYMIPPDAETYPPALSCTLGVCIVRGTVAVTLGGVRRPVTPSMIDEEVCPSATPSNDNDRNNYVQCVLHITSEFDDYAEGRLFISPWLAFRGSFPMRGSYFLQNELFEVEGICRAPWSSLHSASSLRPHRSTLNTKSESLPMNNISTRSTSTSSTSTRSTGTRSTSTSSTSTSNSISASTSTSTSTSNIPSNVAPSAENTRYETAVIHLTRSIPSIFRPRPTSEISRIFRSGFVCCRRFRFPRQLRSYGRHFTGASSGHSQHGNNAVEDAASMAERDVREALYRMVHILENKQREKDWKSGKRRRPLSQRRLSKPKAKSSSSSSSSSLAASPTPAATSMPRPSTSRTNVFLQQAPLPCNNVLALVSDIQKIRQRASASPIVIRQRTIEAVKRIQSRRRLVSWCCDLINYMISQTVDGCRGALVCTCYSLDDVDEYFVRCDQCMRQHHLRCTGLDDVDCAAILNMPKHRASFVCSMCMQKSGLGISTVVDVHTLLDDPSLLLVAHGTGSSSEIVANDDSVLHSVAWWMARAQRMQLNRWTRTSSLRSKVSTCVRAGQECNLAMLRSMIRSHRLVAKDCERDVHRIHFLHGDISSLGTASIIGRYAVSSFLHDLGETMLLAAEEGREESVRVRKQKIRKGKKKGEKRGKGGKIKRGILQKRNNADNLSANGQLHDNNKEEYLGLVLTIDEDVIREMYPILVATHLGKRTMQDIHHALDMSEWDEERANACLRRRSTLRRGQKVTTNSSPSSSSLSSPSSSSSSTTVVTEMETTIKELEIELEIEKPTKWQCRDCTFINPSSHVECSLCECPSTMLPPKLDYVLSYIQHTTDYKNRKKVKGKRISCSEESQCFSCKDGGSLIKCDFSGCKKVFHHACVGIINEEKKQKQSWYCPRHYCSECGAQGKQWVKATTECFLCPFASKCKDHGQWTPLSKVMLSGVEGKIELCGKCSLLVESIVVDDILESRWKHGDSVEHLLGQTIYIKYKGTFEKVEVIQYSDGYLDLECRIQVEYDDGSGKEWISESQVIKRIK